MTYIAHLHIYSGRKNPSWLLSDDDQDELVSRIQCLEPLKVKLLRRPDELGYGGIELVDDDSTQPKVFVHRGFVRVGDSDFIDEDLELEYWLLERAKRFIEKPAVEFLLKELKRRPLDGDSGLTDKKLKRLERLCESLFFLRSYERHSVNSRSFLISEHGILLERIRAGTDKYEGYPLHVRYFLEQRLYVELLERICLLIHDFAVLSNSLTTDLTLLADNIARIDATPLELLKQLTRDDFYTILRYRPIEDNAYSADERELLTKVRDGNLRAIVSLRNSCIAFLELHWSFYQQHIHGNTLVYEVPPITIDDDLRIMVIPTLASEGSPVGLLVTDKIYTSWKRLFNCLAQIVADLVARTAEYINRGELGLLEFSNYVVLTPEEDSSLRRIIRKKDSYRHYFSEKTELNVEVSSETQQRLASKYNEIDEFLDEFIALWYKPEKPSDE